MASREVLSACSSRRLILVGFFFCSWEFDRWVVLRMQSERLCRFVAGGGGFGLFGGVQGVSVGILRDGFWLWWVQCEFLGFAWLMRRVILSIYLWKTCLRRVLRGVLYFPGCGHGFLFLLLLMFLFVVFTRTLDRDSAIENSYVRGLFLRLFCSLDLVKVPCSVLLLFFFFYCQFAPHAWFFGFSLHNFRFQCLYMRWKSLRSAFDLPEWIGFYDCDIFAWFTCLSGVFFYLKQSGSKICDGTLNFSGDCCLDG